MKRLQFKLLLLILIFLTFCCSSISELTRGGIGQPISTVMDRYGPPSRVTSDGSGGSIYIWEQWVDKNHGSRDLWSTMYWVDSKGIIYKWR